MKAKTNDKKHTIASKELNLDGFKTLEIEGTEYITTLNWKFENRKPWSRPDPKLIYSFIPGSIINIFVKEGQEVDFGEPLVILEAMKMRNIVRMPMAGIIKSINVKEGEKVSKGHLIISIE